MAKRRSTTVEGYYRKGHYTTGHKRMLNDSMMLELAEGNPLAEFEARSLVSKADQRSFYLCVPDPQGISDSIFVRADLLNVFDQSSLNELLQYCKPYNSKATISAIKKHYNQTARSLRDGVEGVETDSEGTDWVAIVETVVDIWDEVEGWFGGGDSGGTSVDNPGTIVNANGLVCMVYVVAGQVVFFGVHPQMRQVIAFSSPAKLRSVFNNLPRWNWDSFPVLPVGVPGGMSTNFLKFVLQHPDTLCREKGTGFEVVPGSYVSGTDPNDNPIIDPPPPPPGNNNGSSSGSMSSLLTIGAGLLLLK